MRDCHFPTDVRRYRPELYRSVFIGFSVKMTRVLEGWV